MINKLFDGEFKFDKIGRLKLGPSLFIISNLRTY